jgi:very-short-patch-repair endonuclease
VDKLLHGLGWEAMRLWESDVLAGPGHAARAVLRVVRSGRHRRDSP